MKQNLSTTVSVTSTYAGEKAGDYIMAALLAAPTLGNKTITIKPNIKFKQVVKKGVTSGLIGAKNCDFTPTGQITLTERILEPAGMQVNLQVCKEDFRSDWDAVSMGMSAFDSLPASFSDFLIGNIGLSIGADLEVAIWQYNSVFSGFTTLFKADSDVVDVSGTTITPSNVIVELTKAATAASALNTYGAGEKPVIYAAKNVMFSYMIALGGFGASGLGANGYKGEGPTGVQNAPLYFGGLELVQADGLNSSEIVIAQPSNLWFGTGILNDTNKVQVIDTSETLGDDNVRFISKFTAGVQYGIGSEIVYYWIF